METFSLILIVILGATTLIAFFLLMDVFFSRKIGRIQQVAEQMTGRSFLLGLVNFLFLGVICVALISVSENFGLRFLAIPTLLIALILAVGLLLGLSAITQLVGERLFPEHELLKQKTWGAGLLILGCLAPFVGWFGFLPFVALLGLGALIGDWFPRKGKEQPEPEQ
ncbi:MAG: hypothetical protein ISS57_06035 [Anaerolineales bacterium]|nr:hypothetical protein [Chloroflexota bacterium]MBL7162145.1 hypothetical protein [Anaerolineales bacterium]